MASAAPPTRDPSPTPPKLSGKVVSYEEYIERQIAKTRQHVKWVDIAGTLMALVGGTLAYLLLIALVDHWLLSEGLGFGGRMIALLGLVAGAGAYVAIYLLPLLVKRINPVYAAQAIEHTRPSLKNTLVNFLLLRSSPEGVPQPVYQAVEQQAAARLSQVQVESAVDRTKLIRISAVVLGVVTVCCLYTVFSPKNPLQTVRRVVLPWADIAVPTRVAIEEVSPGDTSIFYDGFVEVRALVRGIDESDPVTAYYSTADGQLVNQAVPLQKPADGFRYLGILPAGSNGLRQDIHYYVVAGDARSKQYHVQVRPAPTITVDHVEYDYPQYTGLEPYVSKHGDLKAIEGTRVTLHVKANQKIAAAWVDLDCKGTRNKRLTAEDREGMVKLPLKMSADGQTPEFTSYQIRFTNEEGHENPQPIRHTVEVVRDLPPEIKLVEPTQPHVELPANGRLEWKVWARDADFALSRVEVMAERENRRGDLLIAESLLNEVHDGPFEGTYVFDPARLKLKPGDSIRYWAEARDNRQPDDSGSPQPNRSETEKFRITIVEPLEQKPGQRDAAQQNNPQQKQPQKPQDQPEGKPQPQQGQRQQGDPQQGQEQNQQQPGQPQDQPADGQNQQPADAQQQGEGGQKGAAGQPSKDAQGEKGEGGQGGQQGDPQQGQEDRRVDPMTNPGDAFEKINEHLRQQQKEQQQSPKDGQQPQNNNDGQNQQPPQQPQQQGEGQKQQPMNGQQQQPQQGQESKQQQQPGGGQQGAQQPQVKPSPDQQGGGGQGQQPNDSSQQPGGENSRPGEGQQPSDAKSGQQSGNAGQKPSGTGQGAKPQNAEKPEPGKDPERPQDAPPGEKAQPMPGQKPEGEAAQSGDNATPPTENATRDAQGQGSEVKGAGDPKQPNERPPGQKPDIEGGDRDTEKGPGGAGRKTDDKPSPSTHSRNQSRGEKEQRSPDNQERQGEQENPKSPTTSPKQSDSQGESEGDRSGGGKSGGGQTASGVEGTGGPGSSTASDQGQKKAPGSGEGETGDKAGNKVQSDKPTGQSDPQQRSGDGSQQRPGTSKSGGQKSDQPQSPAGKPQSAEPSNEPQGEGNAQDGGTGQPGGQQPSGKPGGQQGEFQPGDAPQGQRAPAASKPPAGEDPNLEYARKATDLALEHLKDQLAKDEPDPELLDKLKWTREDLQRFVEHWERMKRQAAQPGKAGEEARKKLDDSLRGLGLQPRGTQMERNTEGGDNLRNLRSSRRIAPPPEYAEQVKAYKQRLSRGQEK